MDNQWQPSKCGSRCQSSAEPSVMLASSPVSQVHSHDSSRNSMMNPNHYYNPHIAQGPSPSTHKMMTDPLFQPTNINLYNSNLSVMGNSFFTLLSGPPASFPKYDSQQVSTSKPSNPSNKIHVYNSNSILGPTECEPSFISPKLSSQNIDNRHLNAKTVTCPVSNPRLGLSKPANYHTSHGNEHLNGYSSLKSAPTCGPTSTPVNCHQVSPIANGGLPRVFCLYASGDLFLSSSRVLGVVCCCHGIRMSISKFSEHAGLEDINPGDAVHTDTGETIAQWRKVYFGKIGIRIPEDQHGWHWPQQPPDFVNKTERRTSDMSRPLNNMVFPDKHHSNSHNLVNQILSHQVQRNTETSQSNNKIMEQLVSGCFKQPDTIFSGGLNNSFQSTPTSTYIDPIYKTKNPFTSQNSLQNLSNDSHKVNNSKDVDTRVKATVPSNIELRLGQPSQQSNPPAFHTSHVSKVGHPLHLISSQPKLYNGSNRITEESKQYVDCAAEAAKSSSIERQNQLRFSNLGFGAFSTRMTVMNPNPPSLGVQQAVKYINQDDHDVSSSCGFGQDQIVPANSPNQILKNSVILPPKLTEGTDGYKDKSAMVSGTTPCSYVQDKCSCWVQRNTSKNSISAFGQPSQIRNSLISGSNMEKDCSLHGGFTSSGKIGEPMKKPKVNAFQWKDVPTKMSERCKDQKAKFLEDTNDVDVNGQDVEKVECMKEQVMSNVSSKCSLTQASVKVSNGDSCTDDAHCEKNLNFAVDEGSGIQKSFSDDDALDSASKVNSKDGNRSTRSLIDELRVIDSFRLKKVHTGVTIHEHTTTSMNTFEKDFESGKRKRETKFKILEPDSSLSTGSSGQSSQSLEDLDTSTEELELPCKKPKRVYDDFLEITEGKKTRLDLDFDFDFSKRKPCKRAIRPVVCGKYGLISNGDTSKPAKIFSLGKILKTSKRCDPTTPSENKVVKKPPPPKVLKKPRFSEGSRRSGRISGFKEVNYQIDQETEDPIETSNDTDTSYMLKKKSESKSERSHEIQDSDFGTKRKKKIKEVRIRSLYDLITKGNVTIKKDIPSEPQDKMSNLQEVETKKSTEDVDTSCHVCGGVNNDEINTLLECNRCFIKVHQACYGVSKVPKSQWCCRPCRENASNTVCVLCGYEGGLMTGAFHTTNIARTLLDTWNVNVLTESRSMVVNTVTLGFFDSSVKQWVHMVCGLWTPGTRCPNVDTMSTFDISGASNPQENIVCSLCKRGGGCCIRCRVIDCAVHFHPWCAHQKGLLQSEVEGADNESVGFYGRCELHGKKDSFNQRKINFESIKVDDKRETCARTEGYKGRKREGFRHDDDNQSKSSGCVVGQEQVDAWNYINQQLLLKKRTERTPQPFQDVVESDPRKEYGRYIQSKGWKHLVVYKSGIHALGLYTSLFISQSEMVVEYIGEIVGLRVADRREKEYESGKQLQYKSACYFFRIDKEHIIDATRKGGIARFVNHSCQPNCVAKVITVRGEKKVVFFAERDIYPGEEITYDYHFNNEDEAKKILCSCNSSNCRRYLN